MERMWRALRAFYLPSVLADCVFVSFEKDEGISISEYEAAVTLGNA